MLTLQVDTFTIRAVDMISLTKVTVGHDGLGEGNGWFLDKVVVKDTTHAVGEFVFTCQRYIQHKLCIGSDGTLLVHQGLLLLIVSVAASSTHG